MFLPQVMRPLPARGPVPEGSALARIQDVPCSLVTGPRGSVAAERLAAALAARGRWDGCVWLRAPADGALPGLLAAACTHRWADAGPDGAVVVVELPDPPTRDGARLLGGLRRPAAERGVRLVVVAEDVDSRAAAALGADLVVPADELGTVAVRGPLDPATARRLLRLTRARPAVRLDVLDAAAEHPDAVAAAVRGAWRCSTLLDRLTAELVERGGERVRAPLEAALRTGYRHPQLAGAGPAPGDLRPWLVPLEGRWSWMRPVWRPAVARALGLPDVPAVPPALFVPSRPAPPLLPAGPDGPPEPAARPVLQVRLTGPFECRIDGSPVTRWNGPRGQSVLRYLLHRPGHACSRDELIEEFWPGVPEAAARNRLQVAVSGVRRALAAASPVPIVEYADGGYRIVPNVRVDTDLAQFTARVAEARAAERAGDADGALARYGEALTHCRGDLAADAPYEAWTLLPRETLRLEHLDVLDRCVRLHLRAERWDDAVALAHRMLDLDPCREDVHRLLMRCYVRQGRPYHALRQFELCERVLRATLEQGPDARTLALRDEIRVSPTGPTRIRSSS